MARPLLILLALLATNDPVAGRFLSTDPAGFAGSTWDLYSFADNDPLNRFDADGRIAAGFLNGAGQWGSRSYASMGNALDAVLNPVVGLFDPLSAATHFSGGYEENPVYQRNFEQGSSWQMNVPSQPSHARCR